jgi:hypothetical protein
MRAVLFCVRFFAGFFDASADATGMADPLGDPSPSATGVWDPLG